MRRTLLPFNTAYSKLFHTFVPPNAFHTPARPHPPSRQDSPGGVDVCTFRRKLSKSQPLLGLLYTHMCVYVYILQAHTHTHTHTQTERERDVGEHQRAGVEEGNFGRHAVPQVLRLHQHFLYQVGGVLRWSIHCPCRPLLVREPRYEYIYIYIYILLCVCMCMHMLWRMQKSCAKTALQQALLDCDVLMGSRAQTCILLRI
jgi:hypothetical protein